MTTKEHLTQHDRQIKAIRELVHEGMRLVVATRKDLRTLATLHAKLAQEHRQTQAELRAFIQSMRRGGNGHPPA
jgi:hypothetical protein